MFLDFAERGIAPAMIPRKLARYFR